MHDNKIITCKDKERELENIIDKNNDVIKELQKNLNINDKIIKELNQTILEKNKVIDDNTYITEGVNNKINEIYGEYKSNKEELDTKSMETKEIKNKYNKLITKYNALALHCNKKIIK